MKEKRGEKVQGGEEQEGIFFGGGKPVLL
jgi:hypothetical protein